jgi:hypothetical protein
MSKNETIVNKVNEVAKTRLNGNYSEYSEMTAIVHGNKMDIGRFAKKIRELKKLDKDFNISSKHSQNSHKCKCDDWDDSDYDN